MLKLKVDCPTREEELEIIEGKGMEFEDIREYYHGDDMVWCQGT